MKNHQSKFRTVAGMLTLLTCLFTQQPITRAAALTDGLHGYWPFNEGTGTQVVDASNNHPPGELRQNDGASPEGLGTGGGLWVTDPVRGTVLGFTGDDADGYAFLGAEIIPPTDLTDGFTWSFWAKSDQANNNDIIVGNRYGTDNAEITPVRQWAKFTGNQFEWRPNDVAGNLNYADIAVQTEWMHHLVTRDADVLRYYRNGVLTLTGPALTTPLETALPFYVGGQGRENWRGYVDEVMLLKRALSPEEVTVMYQLTLSGSLNDVLTPGPAKVAGRSPISGGTGAAFDTIISATILEGTTKLNDSTVQFTVNGQVVPHTIGTRVQLTADVSTVIVSANAPVFPNLYAATSTVTVELRFSDSAGAAKEENWSFAVQEYISVPPAWAAADVNTSQRGFLVRTHLLDNRRHVFGDRGARIPPAENQLAGRVGPNVANPADFTSNGYFIEDTYINYNQAAFGRGDAGSSEGMFGASEIIVKAENAIPGLEGAILDPEGENSYAALIGSDHAALEILAYVELPAGIVSMGVNSDDGFRLTISPLGAPADKFGAVVAEFDGGRGSSPTEGTVGRMVIEQAGIYAMRLMWYEGQGGFNGEWYSVQADGTPVLINDPDEAAAIKAYTSRTGAGATHVSVLTPFPFGSTLDFAYPDDPIHIEITDGTTPVNQESIVLTINGQPRNAPELVKTQSGTKTTLQVNPPAGIWPPGDLTVKLAYTAGADASYEWTVPMISYVTLEECLRTAVGTGREPGMKWQTHWIRTGTRANNVAAAEDQLANLPNDADLSGATDGFFDIANVNFDQIGAVQGLFGDSRFPPRNDAELPVPGIPADAPADPNYIVGEARTFVEFPTAGVYYMGVNRDDGFRLTVASAEGGRDLVNGPNVQELGVYNAGGGTDANNVQANGFMVVHVPQPGVWPLRLLWYEGTGGGNVEWFQTDKQKPIGLVNDNLTASTLRAFMTRAAQPPAPDDALCSPVVAPTIAVTRDAQGQVVLTFAGTLEQADEAAGAYSPVAGATSPHTVAISQNQTRKFYRSSN
jgi:hypothetical protein